MEAGGDKKERCFIKQLKGKSRKRSQLNVSSGCDGEPLANSRSDVLAASKIRQRSIMLFVCVLGVRVTYMLVISRVIPFILWTFALRDKSSPSWRLLGALHWLFILLIIKASGCSGLCCFCIECVAESHGTNTPGDLQFYSSSDIYKSNDD